ncbi:hypothetical protein RO21_02050, partial [[Actinobacillus] muris]
GGSRGINARGLQCVFVEKVFRLIPCPLSDKVIHRIILLMQLKALRGVTCNFIAVGIVIAKKLQYLTACVRDSTFLMILASKFYGYDVLF